MMPENTEKVPRDQLNDMKGSVHHDNCENEPLSSQ